MPRPHDRLLGEVDRVLSTDGLLILSAPDRRMNSVAFDRAYPFHERELNEAELRALLGRRFERVALWGQRATNGSRIAALDDSGSEKAQSVFLKRTGDDCRECSEGPQLNLIAVASHNATSNPSRESNLADYGLELMRARACESHLATQEAHAAR